jgi:hypothetical protein
MPVVDRKMTRLNLEVPESVRTRLEELRVLTEAQSMTEVIRRALAVYEFLVQEKSAGHRLIVDRGTERVEVALMG